MMKSFITSGSLSRGMEVDEVPDEGGTTPFPGEDGHDDPRWPPLAREAPRT
jgi:hypothetical protein